MGSRGTKHAIHFESRSIKTATNVGKKNLPGSLVPDFSINKTGDNQVTKRKKKNVHDIPLNPRCLLGILMTHGL